MTNPAIFSETDTLQHFRRIRRDFRTGQDSRSWPDLLDFLAQAVIRPHLQKARRLNLLRPMAAEGAFADAWNAIVHRRGAFRRRPSALWAQVEGPIAALFFESLLDRLEDDTAFGVEALLAADREFRRALAAGDMPFGGETASTMVADGQGRQRRLGMTGWQPFLRQQTAARPPVITRIAA